MSDKLTYDELNELRMYAAEFNTPESKHHERRITEVMGDRNDYYDTKVILKQCVDGLPNEEDIWQLINLADELIEADLITKL